LTKSQKLGGSGGLIAVDKKGNVVLPFNTSGMYRGFLAEDGTFVVDIYRDR
jgi:beta-aspartyl-peptidase (threonine type)